MTIAVTFILYLLVYYLKMGNKILNLLQRQTILSKKNYFFNFVVMQILIMLSMGNTVQIYIILPIATILHTEICSDTFQQVANTLLIYGYCGPLVYGLIIIQIMKFFAVDKQGSQPTLGEIKAGHVGQDDLDSSVHTMSD